MSERCKCGAAQRGHACACGILERSVEPVKFKFEEKACYCASRQCDICTPVPPRGDLRAAVQMLAADNARFCDIALKADKLAEAALALIVFSYTSKHARERFERALQDYHIVRNGS